MATGLTYPSPSLFRFHKKLADPLADHIGSLAFVRHSLANSSSRQLRAATATDIDSHLVFGHTRSLVLLNECIVAWNHYDECTAHLVSQCSLLSNAAFLYSSGGGGGGGGNGDGASEQVRLEVWSVAV